jgi:hypothetical protein
MQRVEGLEEEAGLLEVSCYLFVITDIHISSIAYARD